MIAREVIAYWLASGGAWERELDEADALVAALARRGFAVLPVEPTEVMIRAARGCRSLREDDGDIENMDSNTRDTWTGMIAAEREGWR